ncbi:MAG: hypothetical protein QOH93_2738 [Chloroflexia bacterium]|jgi:hypothetical protein|nr:hypothetical protein [Chloroflexia bacterium]
MKIRLAGNLVEINEAGEHDFIIPPNIDKAVILEGEWESFNTSRARKSQVEADKVSYFWDSLIQEFTKHAFAASQYYTTDSSIMVQEQILRFLAREPRTPKRMLADKLLEMVGTTPPGA